MTSGLSDIERRLRDAFDASETITRDWGDGSVAGSANSGHEDTQARGWRWVLPGAAAAAVAAIAVSLVLITQGHDDRHASAASPGATSMNDHSATSRVIDGVTWTISVDTGSSGIPCVSVSASAGRASGSIGGGCGTTGGTFSRLGEGGLRIGRTNYNVAYGLAAADVSRVQVTLANGTSLSSPVTDGAWFVVVKRAAVAQASDDFSLVRALNDNGTPIAHRRLPPLSAYRAGPSKSHAGTR